MPRPSDPRSLERGVRQLLANKASGNLLGPWLLLPEHLRLGTWELLCGWSGCSPEQVEPRIGLQLIHEAALCNRNLRYLGSLSQRGFELANGLPFVVSHPAVHNFLDTRTVAQTQQLQVALGQMRKANGHFIGKLLAVDPHRVRSYSKRQMRQRKEGSEGTTQKMSQTFFCIDAQTCQPLCCTLTTSAPSVSQASPALLEMTQAILNCSPNQTLVMADCEHYTDGMIAHIQQHTPFDLLTPVPRTRRIARIIEAIEADKFTRNWAGYASTKLPFKLDQGQADPCWLFVDQTGERPEETTRNAFLCTGDRPELEDLAINYPKRWHIEEFFNRDDALGWDYAGTMNINIRYATMTMGLFAQAALHQLRPRLGEQFANANAETIAQGLLAALDGDIRVCKDTIIVTCYNAPESEAFREQFCDLPNRLLDEGVDPHIPWLYNLKLDFRFK